jgi:hypothetical protein
MVAMSGLVGRSAAFAEIALRFFCAEVVNEKFTIDLEFHFRKLLLFSSCVSIDLTATPYRVH